MSLKTLRELLRNENPAADTGKLEQYANQLAIYLEASKNLAANGAVVADPRTGEPMANPYGKIQIAAMAQLAAVKMPKTTAAWEFVRDEIDTAAAKKA